MKKERIENVNATLKRLKPWGWNFHTKILQQQWDRRRELPRRYFFALSSFNFISNFLIDIVIISKGSYSLLYSESFELVCFLSFLLKSKN